MHEFKSQVQLALIGSHNIEPAGGEVEVRWNLDIEMRSWGIKNFVITVPDQEVTTMVWKYNEETDEEYQEELTLHVKDVKVEVSDGGRRLDGLAPTLLEVWNNKYTLDFV